MDSSSSKIKGALQAADSLDKSKGLPRSYGDTKIVILPRDPLWFYAYWEVAAETYAKMRERLGEGKFTASKWALRVYDITNVVFDGKNDHKHFDIILGFGSDNWYVNVGEANRVWVVDLGMITPDGEFIVIARSNVLAMPRLGVSSITDEQWAILQVEFERLLKLSGVEQIGRSSFDIAKLMKERWEEIVSVSLPSSHMGSSSWSKKAGESKPKGFWLKADTELIVYGATEPDAKLTVQGKPVALRPDGSFSLRFYLPDGKQEYPIHAVSSDGTMEREITFVVNRSSSSKGF
jgi:uncharacterized protein